MCPKNKYCEKDGLIAGVTMPNGYNAVEGAPIKGPNLLKSESPKWHLCDKGYFCDTANDATARQK